MEASGHYRRHVVATGLRSFLRHRKEFGAVGRPHRTMEAGRRDGGNRLGCPSGSLGKGLRTEGMRAAIDWAIDHLGWTEINHCIDADNAASISVAHRLGAEWLRADHDAHGKETQVYGRPPNTGAHADSDCSAQGASSNPAAAPIRHAHRRLRARLHCLL